MSGPTTTDLDIVTEVREYQVVPRALVDSEYGDDQIWGIVVAYRGRGRWGVFRGSAHAMPPTCLGSDGTWDYESIPSERRDEWLATHRFDLNTALRLAREQLPLIRVNGLTTAQVVERRSAGA